VGVSLLVTWTAAHQSQAVEPVLSLPGLERLALGPYLQLLEDKAKRWTFKDVTSPQVASRFAPPPKTSLAFGFTSSAYWVRFTVSNPCAREIQWFLELAYPPMDRIDVFIPQDAGRFAQRTTGDHFPFRTREVQHRNFIFLLREPPNSQRTYYMRLENAGPMNIPLSILSPSALAEKVNYEQLLLGIYHGAIIVMLIYNLFLFVSIGDKSYLYYVLFNSGWVLAMLTLNGLASQYLWPSTVWWSNNILLFCFCFAFFWGVQFSRSFLETSHITPIFDKILCTLLLISIFGMLVSIVGSYYFSVRLTNIIGMLSLLVWMNGFICLARGSRSARYYVIAWSALIVGVATLSLKNLGVLPHNTFTVWAPQIGSATEITLLSLGLADRIKTLQREKDSAQQELLATRLSMQDTLLKEVHHRVKNNLQVIASLLNLQSGYAKGSRAFDMFKESQHRVESMALIHDRLYHSLDAAKIDFAEYTRTLCEHLHASYSPKTAAITLHVDVDNVVLGVDTAIPCGLIITELVTNALKHAFPGRRRGEVSIHLHPDREGRFTLLVRDNGVGFPPEVDFRRTESLGLQLVNTLTEQLDGTIGFESHGGATFRVAFTELHYTERR
jgi:two-component sensor histidine kinase